MPGASRREMLKDTRGLLRGQGGVCLSSEGPTPGSKISAGLMGGTKMSHFLGAPLPAPPLVRKLGFSSSSSLGWFQVLGLRGALPTLDMAHSEFGVPLSDQEAEVRGD